MTISYIITLSLLGAMASISSMKIIEGAFFLASSKANNELTNFTQYGNPLSYHVSN